PGNNISFYEAADKIYHFIWHEFCDWYLELVKPELKTRNNTSYAVLIDMLDRILKLLHPFMPFVTEEIWQKLPGSGESLVTAEFPAEEDAWCNKDAEKVLNQLQKLI
ncbi:unnamed protein product, partial [marine sediment metagenome]